MHALKNPQAFCAVSGNFYLIAFLLQVQLQQTANIGIIFYNQDLLGHTNAS